MINSGGQGGILDTASVQKKLECKISEVVLNKTVHFLILKEDVELVLLRNVMPLSIGLGTKCRFKKQLMKTLILQLARRIGTLGVRTGMFLTI